MLVYDTDLEEIRNTQKHTEFQIRLYMLCVFRQYVPIPEFSLKLWLNVKLKIVSNNYGNFPYLVPIYGSIPVKEQVPLTPFFRTSE